MVQVCTMYCRQQINLSKAALKQAKRIAENALRSIEVIYYHVLILFDNVHDS
jgi:hypothetical protein